MYSVIIRVKNEEQFIGHSIQSCIDFLDNPEIIIINDNSKDKSLYISRLFIYNEGISDNIRKNFCNLKIINIEDYTPGKALNVGVKNATNDDIVILSGHCVIKKFKKELIKSNLEKFGVLFGNQTPYYHGKRINKNYLWSNFVEEEVINMWSSMEKRYFFHNAASIFKKEILINNPFDEKLAGKEDRYWANRWINEIEGKILYQPQFSVDHFYTVEGNTWKGIG